MPMRKKEVEGFRGVVTVRMTHELHAAVKSRSWDEGVSMNEWIVNKLAQVIEEAEKKSKAA